MPLRLPVVFEEPGHACITDLPLLDAVFPDLLDGWFSHRLAGTYADPPEADALLRFRLYCCPDYQNSSSAADCLGGSVKSDTFS